MSEDVRRRLREAILDRGPITFAEYMEIALYSPGGFYDQPPVGSSRESHFVTSPHVHPVFGELLASGVRDLWDRLGRPAPFALVEMGAGDGTLAGQLLESLGDLATNYTAVERSAGARASLSKLPVHVVERLDQLGSLRDVVVITNELLDNLPFRRVRAQENGPVEVRLNLDAESGIREIESPIDAELVSLVPDGLRAGDEIAIPVGGLAFIDELAAHLERGYAVLIDYGSAGEGGSRPTVGDELHGYRGHGVVEDVLADPGGADITVGVDFASLGRRATERDLVVHGIPTQREALGALGFGSWMRGELERQAQLVSERAGVESVRAWSGRSAATLLVDPSALGRHRWLVLGTRGTRRPGWLGDDGSRGEATGNG